MMKEEMKKNSDEDRYIHSIKIDGMTGRMLLFTANAYLLSLIHNTEALQVDTTFKRVAGDLNEWEVVMWDNASQRGEFFN
jgi:hypothetical protein